MSANLLLPQGFRGSGLAAGIKKSGAKDLALIVNEGPIKFGTAVFTSNKIVAAPVTWSRTVVKDHEVSAILLNSGGANACTGPAGFADTHKSGEYLAEKLGVSSADIVICSTGMIGERLPMERVLSGIDSAVAALSSGSGHDLAEAIMTTDTHPKFFARDFKGARIFGMAKGAGMLAPSLATMLVVIAIDAVPQSNAAEIFERAISETFNRIDSDGCMSTNDTVTFMASGSSGITLSDAEFYELLFECCDYLAKALINDAEGHSKVISITTKNAASIVDAELVGKACARNNLLKCAIHGEDPNWGRILAAIGTVNASFDPYVIDVSMNGVMVCRDSAPGDERTLVDMSGKQVDIVIDLKSGSHEATIWTNDLTAEYVHENSDYSS